MWAGHRVRQRSQGLPTHHRPEWAGHLPKVPSESNKSSSGAGDPISQWESCLKGTSVQVAEGPGCRAHSHLCVSGLFWSSFTLFTVILSNKAWW